jgi:hypothetical protein
MRGAGILAAGAAALALAVSGPVSATTVTVENPLLQTEFSLSPKALPKRALAAAALSFETRPPTRTAHGEPAPAAREIALRLDTNPSMWRCVELSDFYAPYDCRPGSVDPLPIVAPEVPPKPDTPAPAPGTAKLSLKVAPKLLSVGPAREKVSYKLTVANVGDAASGKLSICASAPKARLKAVGKKCVGTELAASGALVRSFQFELKPAAVGKLTKITFTVDGIVVGSKSVKAQLKVREG